MWNRKDRGANMKKTTNHTQSLFSSKRCGGMYMEEVGGSPLQWTPFRDTNDSFKLLLLEKGFLWYVLCEISSVTSEWYLNSFSALDVTILWDIRRWFNNLFERDTFTI